MEEMLEIKCINKDAGDHHDPHEGITDLGWLDENTGETGKHDRAQMVEFLKAGNKAYVDSLDGRRAYLVVRVSRWGNEYVKTIADDEETNNLLELPECS